MVDFRYHLVSLISVFLALSVGIILGAGPLQNSIGQALTGQVNSLRNDNAALKAENDTLENRAKQQDEALATLTPSVLADSLTGQNVAIVRLPGVDDAALDSATTGLKAAGANIAINVTLTDVWVASERNAYRSAFASQIVEYVKGVDSQTEADTVLTTGLAQLVRAGDSEEKNATLLQLFVESDNALIAGTPKLGGSADAVLILAPDAEAPAATKDKTADTQAAALIKANRDMFVKIAHSTAQGGATVLAGAGNSPEDAVSAEREAKKLSTVDNPQTVLGALNMPIAIAHALNGENVHLGTDGGAQAALGTLVKKPKNTEE